MRPWSIWIGFDPREAAAFAVARESIRQYNRQIPIHGLELEDLRARGLYTRPTEKRLGRMWDVRSEAFMSTEFACSRFLLPYLTGGLALFMDCDVLVRTNVTPLFARAEAERGQHALWCVHHDYTPSATEKMDGQAQTAYPRKNWSSVMMMDCDHPSNKALTIETVNNLPGRELHRFCWLKDEEIGEFDRDWNHLVGEQVSHANGPKIAHFTNGGPWFTGFEDVPYADEWRSVLRAWAAT